MKIYFVLCNTTGRVKCGIAINTRSRIAHLQSGSPTILHLIGEMEGGRSREKAIHRKLTRWRCHGEWFHYVVEVREVIIEELTSQLEDREYGLYVARTRLESKLPQAHPYPRSTRPSQ